MSDGIVTKHCSKCKQSRPATMEYLTNPQKTGTPVALALSASLFQGLTAPIAPRLSAAETRQHSCASLCRHQEKEL